MEFSLMIIHVVRASDPAGVPSATSQVVSYGSRASADTAHRAICRQVSTQHGSPACQEKPTSLKPFTAALVADAAYAEICRQAGRQSGSPAFQEKTTVLKLYADN